MKKLIITLLIVFSHVAYGMEFDLSDIYDDNVSPHVQHGADEAMGLLDETEIDALLDSDVESARTTDNSAPQSTRTESCFIDPIKVDTLFNAYPETQAITISDEMKLPASTDDAVCTMSCSKSFDQYAVSDAMSDAICTFDSNNCNGCFQSYGDVPALPVADDSKEAVQKSVSQGSDSVLGIGSTPVIIPNSEKTDWELKRDCGAMLRDSERCGDVFVLIHTLIRQAKNGDSFLLKTLIGDHFFDIYDHIATLVRADDYDDLVVLILYGLPLYLHPVDRQSLLFIASVNKRTKIQNLLLGQSVRLSDEEKNQLNSSKQRNDFMDDDLKSTLYRQMLQIYFTARNLFVLQSE